MSLSSHYLSLIYFATLNANERSKQIQARTFQNHVYDFLPSVPVIMTLSQFHEPFAKYLCTQCLTQKMPFSFTKRITSNSSNAQIQKLFTRCQFHQRSMFSFFVRRAQKQKKTVKLSVFLHFRDLRAQKLCVKICW